jgi:hypothetical protein
MFEIMYYEIDFIILCKIKIIVQHKYLITYKEHSLTEIGTEKGKHVGERFVVRFLKMIVRVI